MIFVIILLAVAGTEAGSLNPTQDYFDCVAVNSGVLEASGEPASTVAVVALDKCEKRLDDAAKASVLSFENRPDMIKYRKTYPMSAEEEQSALRQAKTLLVEGAKNLALRVVVEKRAKAARK